MELFQAIKERYSYRGAFEQKPLPEADLRKIVQAGLDAPSGKNLQTTRFIVINDPDKLDRVESSTDLVTEKEYLRSVTHA